MKSATRAISPPRSISSRERPTARACAWSSRTRAASARLLRERYHAEACGGYNYARAGEETLDLCLGKLFAAMSADEYRHADILMRLLGRRMRCL